MGLVYGVLSWVVSIASAEVDTSYDEGIFCKILLLELIKARIFCNLFDLVHFRMCGIEM